MNDAERIVKEILIGLTLSAVAFGIFYLLSLYAPLPKGKPVEQKTTIEKEIIPPPEIEEIEPPTPQQLLSEVASKKGLKDNDIKQIANVIHCESSWRPDAVGDNGTSYGLVQIHLPAHPHITAEQAQDPEFAIDFITDSWLTHDQWKWTCYRRLYG